MEPRTAAWGSAAYLAVLLGVALVAKQAEHDALMCVCLQLDQPAIDHMLEGHPLGNVVDDERWCTEPTTCGRATGPRQRAHPRTPEYAHTSSFLRAYLP